MKSQHPQGSDRTGRTQHDHERLRQRADVVDVDQRVAEHLSFAHPRVDLHELGVEAALCEGLDALDLFIVENEGIRRHFLRVGKCQLERFTLGVEDFRLGVYSDESGE